MIDIDFKAKKWRYSIHSSSDIIGIQGKSGIGKTKFANDLYQAYLAKFIRSKVVLIKSESEMYQIAWRKISNSLIAVDNLEMFSTSGIQYLTDVINKNNNKWILIGHSNLELNGRVDIKELSVDRENKLITLK